MIMNDNSTCTAKRTAADLMEALAPTSRPAKRARHAAETATIPSTKTRTTKRVQFAPVIVASVHHHYISNEHEPIVAWDPYSRAYYYYCDVNRKRDLWYTVEDFEYFKSCHRWEVQTFFRHCRNKKRERDHKAAMTTKAGHNHHHNYDHTVSSSWEIPKENRDRSMLYYMTARELWSESRRSQRRALYDEIFYLQELQFLADTEEDQSRLVESMRHASEQLSQPSRHFAQHVADKVATSY